ncbi:hypothetical protein FF1_014457 [Malus domestica]
MFLNPIHQLLHSYPSLHSHPLLLLIHLQNLVHQRQIDHPCPGQSNPIRRQSGPNWPNPGFLLVGILHDLLQLLKRFGLVENPGLDLVGPAPVGDGVEVLRQRSIPENLGLFMLGVLGEKEGVVGGGGAEQDEGGVAQVLAELGG